MGDILGGPFGGGVIALVFSFFFIVIPVMIHTRKRFKEYVEEEEVKDCMRRIRLQKTKDKIAAHKRGEW